MPYPARIIAASLRRIADDSVDSSYGAIYLSREEVEQLREVADFVLQALNSYREEEI